MQTEKPTKSPIAVRVYFWILASHLLLAFILLPAAMLAQTSGNAPVLGKSVPGQSAAGIEGTLSTAVNYVGNVIGPLTSGAFFLHAVYANHQGRGALKSVITGVGVLGVSQATRLAEYFVNTGSAGITS
jgi:hypothetical protein